MTSIMPPVLSTDPGLCFSNPEIDFDGCLHQWDGSDLFSVINSCRKPSPDDHNTSLLRNQTDSNNSVLDQVVSEEKSLNRSSSNNSPLEVDERKRRRKISNRESAKRSRMRKQRHLENMRTQLNRLKFENTELVNRLRLILYQCQFVRTENDRLRLEHSFLQDKLSELVQSQCSRQLHPQQTTYASWPRNNTVVTTNPMAPPLITNRRV